MYNNEPFATFREVAEAAGLDDDTAFDRYTSSTLPLAAIGVDMDTMLSEYESAIAFAHMGVNAPECMKKLHDIVKSAHVLGLEEAELKLDHFRDIAIGLSSDESDATYMRSAARAFELMGDSSKDAAVRARAVVGAMKERRKIEEEEEEARRYDYDGPGMFSHWLED